MYLRVFEENTQVKFFSLEVFFFPLEVLSIKMDEYYYSKKMKQDSFHFLKQLPCVRSICWSIHF